MNRKQLYDKIARRKLKPQDFDTYNGNNGRVNKCVELVRNGTLSSGGTLLDVGGGIGDLGYSLNENFDKTILLDISADNLRAGESKGNIALLADVDLDGIPLDNDSVDLVCALDFIEHIVDPENFARECYRILNPDGQVFINTPNIRFWRHIQQLWLGGKFPHTSGDKEVYHGGHLAFFTFNDLCEIFGNSGFSKFEMIKDDEGYNEPPPYILEPTVKTRGLKHQFEYVQLLKELGCPNLLFKCQK